MLQEPQDAHPIGIQDHKPFPVRQLTETGEFFHTLSRVESPVDDDDQGQQGFRFIAGWDMDQIGATKSVDAEIHGVFISFAALNMILRQRSYTPRLEKAQDEQKNESPPHVNHDTLHGNCAEHFVLWEHGQDEA